MIAGTKLGRLDWLIKHLDGINAKTKGFDLETSMQSVSRVEGFIVGWNEILACRGNYQVDLESLALPQATFAQERQQIWETAGSTRTGAFI